MPDPEKQPAFPITKPDLSKIGYTQREHASVVILASLVAGREPSTLDEDKLASTAIDLANKLFEKLRDTEELT